MSMASVWVAAGLFAAFVITSIAIPQLDRLFLSLSSPLGAIQRYPAQVDRPFLRSVGWLFFAYFVTGIVFGLTGGAVGRFALATEADIQIPVDGLRWGFVVGLMVAGLARLRGAGASIGMADSLVSLTAATLAILVFLSISDARLPAPNLFATLRKDQFAAPRNAVLAALAAAAIVELIVVARDWFGHRSVRLVSRAGVRARAEQHEMMEQVFVPQRVQGTTDAVIRRTIEKQGVHDIRWMTNTGPTSHCVAIVESALKWARENGPQGQDPYVIAANLIKANLRVIVPNRNVLDQVRDNLRFDTTRHPNATVTQSLLRRVRVLGTSFRTRLLTMNGKIAVIHLPIPYYGNPTEQSNFAAVSDSTETISELEATFDRHWEGLYATKLQQDICEMFANGKRDQCIVLLVISEHIHGITLGDLTANLRSRGLTPDAQALKEVTDDLRRRSVVVLDSKQQRFYLARRHQTAALIDILVRLVYRDIVV